MTIDAEKYPLFLQMRTPLSRRQDSGSSVSAASWIRTTGKLARQERAVYGALRDHPGATARELALVLAYADVNIPARRLPVLEEKGFVRRGAKRVCQVTGMAVGTWYSAGQVRGTLGGKPQTRTLAKPSVPGPVTTLEDRRRLRKQLMESADPTTRKFLADLPVTGAVDLDAADLPIAGAVDLDGREPSSDEPTDEFDQFLKRDSQGKGGASDE